MRLAFVIERARIDGTVRFVIRQTSLLKARGHEVTVVCADGMWRDRLAAAGAGVEIVAGLAPDGPALSGADRARLRSAGEKSDAVVAVAGKAFPAILESGFDGLVFLDLLSNDLFVGDDRRSAAAVVSAAEEGRLIVHSVEDARAQAERYGFDVADVRFAPLPIDLPHCLHVRSPRKRDDQGGIVVLTAARLDDEHIGYVRPLINAISSLRAQGYSICLDVVGGGKHERQLQEAVPQFVRMLGFRNDLETMYTAADIYVGEGSSRLEAALAGIPVISSAAQTHPEIADHALFLFGMQQGTLHSYRPSPVTPPTTFETALRILLDNSALYSTVAGLGRDRVASEHAPDRYVEFLEKLICAHPLPRGMRAFDVPAATIHAGNQRQDLMKAASTLALNDNVALVVDHPVAWSTFASLPPSMWDTLADAGRRGVGSAYSS